MISFAEKNSSFRAQQYPQYENFISNLNFTLDDFQSESCHYVEEGKSVLVAAPTGAGKTIVGEFAIFLALQSGNKAFYTAPIKALSNQKYQQLCVRYGATRVGLLTGDTNINADADVVVMTTEVLRNMIYANSTALLGLQYVVMDEVHYLADRTRGAVWEEVILHLPPQVSIISLSATVSNAEEFGAWLHAVRGNIEIVVSEHRPVPLWQHVSAGGKLYDLYEENISFDALVKDSVKQKVKVNTELLKLASLEKKSGYGAGRRKGKKPYQHKSLRLRTSRFHVLKELENNDLLPAIYFVFSRIGCDEAVENIINSSLIFTTAGEQKIIEKYLEAVAQEIPAADLAVLGFLQYKEGLLKGIAAHHAGMLPVFKETVEKLFEQGLIKVVFATETLALGINMPARSVILEKLDKFNGQTHVDITPGEYTQFTGRAGRRGIDHEGHAIVLWQTAMDPSALACLASKRSYPLNSSFRPSYNMAVNLISGHSLLDVRQILETSFAQFQADKSVVSLAKKVRHNEASLESYQKNIQCDQGDFIEYSQVRPHLKKHHPCHQCPEREKHLRWAERYKKLSQETHKMRQQIQSRTNTISQIFDRVCHLLLQVNYLKKVGNEFHLTLHGNVLRKIYGENDLLIAQCFQEKVFSSLCPVSLASVVSALVYQPRREGFGKAFSMPSVEVEKALEKITSVWASLDKLEQKNHIHQIQEPDFGLVGAIFMWVKGATLEKTLQGTDLTGGDFVRWARQVIDVLDQIANVSKDYQLEQNAHIALNLMKRGVVAHLPYSGQGL